ncbi:hypothetical protein FJT64_005505 [Amphibalanus amphitrite]|uniref:C-type lectin domain-containing protein n=1 Tax=Amphibalanus amphitrite TaxID=1232801 RepID=A0A6A4W4Q2_AMPAM|nr:hypothetical protein FJT64_008288 [Amphibalanus amphitrite]KAF0297018.1 hypothetical protein FJT64_005505 [Amphibalanus amphitrite]
MTVRHSLLVVLLVPVLVLLVTPPAAPHGPVQYQRGGVQRSAQQLPAPGRPLSRLQCAAYCSRLASCHAWHSDPDSQSCSLYQAPSGADTDVLDGESFGPAQGHVAHTVAAADLTYGLVTSRGTWEAGRAACQALKPSGLLAAPNTTAAFQRVSALLVSEKETCERSAFLGYQCSNTTLETYDQSGQPVVLQADWFENDGDPMCSGEEKSEDGDILCFVIDEAILKMEQCDQTKCAVCQWPAEQP